MMAASALTESPNAASSGYLAVTSIRLLLCHRVRPASTKAKRAVSIPLDLVGPRPVVGRQRSDRCLHRRDRKAQRHLRGILLEITVVGLETVELGITQPEQLAEDRPVVLASVSRFAANIDIAAGKAPRRIRAAAGFPRLDR